MGSDAINTVVETEKQAKSIEETFKEKQKKLKTDNQRALRDYEEEAKASVNAHQKQLDDQRASELAQYKEDMRQENDAKIAEIRQTFEAKQTEIVDYIVGEVTKVYGNS